MAIDYATLNKNLNTYAIDKIYDILSNLGYLLNESQISTFENAIIKNKIIIVDEPNEEDKALFHDDIPSAHGPRTKNDGYIHIYPYIYESLNTEEIEKRYIDEGITLHELYHYIIKLDSPKAENEMEENFGHYLTEGMVQLFAEIHNKAPYKSSGYRKNVNTAKILYEHLKEINSLELIFKNDFKEIQEKDSTVNYLLEYYQKELEFMEHIKGIIAKIAEIKDLDSKRIINRLKKYSIEEIIEETRKNINTLDDNLKNTLNNELKSAEQLIKEQQKKAYN